MGYSSSSGVPPMPLTKSSSGWALRGWSSRRIAVSSSPATSSAGAAGGRGAARLAVNADADLDLAVTELEGGLARGGDGAAGERHAHGRAGGGRPFSQRRAARQVGAGLGRGPHQLLDHQGPGDAAPAGAV